MDDLLDDADDGGRIETNVIVINESDNNSRNVNDIESDENSINGSIDDDDHEEEEFIEHEGTFLKVPKLSQWKEHNNYETINVTVGKARRSLWDQAKQEINMILENIATLELPPDMAINGATPLYKVYQCLFGSSSHLCQTFCQYLKISKEDYLQLIYTFFLCCKNQQSLTSMINSMEFNSKFLMPIYKNIALWNKIKQQKDTIKQEAFWKILEASANQQFKILFLPNNCDKGFPFLLGYDDDKVHFEYSESTDMDGMSKQRHVKDNRRGMTLHTCAYSATCVPLAVSFQRIGESVQDTYFRSISGVFGIGFNGLPNLKGVTLASDRGYWEKSILFGQMLESGADIVGTVKRSDWFPLTFDHPENKPFPAAPLDILTQGYRDFHHYQAVWRGRNNEKKLNAIAYRSGSGSGAVALAISTTESNLHWDLVPEKYKDFGWFFDQNICPNNRKMKGFTRLIGESSNEIETNLLNLVSPRTCGSAGQGSKEWFLDRMFSGTSSQINFLFVAAAPLLIADPSIGENKKQSLVRVAKFIGQEDLVLTQQNDPEEVELEDECEVVEENENEHKIVAKEWIVKLTNNSLDEDGNFLSSLPTIENVVLDWIMHILNGEPPTGLKISARSWNERKLRGFLEKEGNKELRPFILQKKAQLQTLAKKKRKKFTQQTSKNELIRLILEPESEESGSEDNGTSDDENLAPLVAILQHSFLRPKKSKSERNAAKKGHENEEIFLLQFWEKYKQNQFYVPFPINLPEILVIFRPGLVKKKTSITTFVKDSADGIAVFKNEDDSPRIMPVEVKSRVSLHSSDNAKQRLKNYLGVERYHPQQKYFFRLSAGDPELFRLVGDNRDPKRAMKEMMQLLHHVHTYGVNSCLLIVGSESVLLYAVEVLFDSPQLLQSYNDVMNLLFDRYYSVFYEDTFDNSTFAKISMEKVLEKHNKGKKKADKVSMHSFLSNYRLWRALNVNVDQRNISFPLPPIDKFVPVQNAQWNAAKGPSDTLTKLFDDSEENITVRSPQTVAVSRILSVSATAFHRCLQILSSNENVEAYETIGHYRNAANRRSSFKSSLSQLCDFLWHELNQIQQQNQANMQIQPRQRHLTPRRVLREIPKTPQQRRSSRNGETIPTQQWNDKWHDGITPGKIRGRPGREKRQKIEEHSMRRQECLGVVLCFRAGARVRCELCSRLTSYYCSGCRSPLCFQTSEMGDSKMEAIKKSLKISPFDTLPKQNKISIYDPTTKQRTEIRTYNSCYHIMHNKKFSSYFQVRNNMDDGRERSGFDGNDDGSNDDENDNQSNGSSRNISTVAHVMI